MLRNTLGGGTAQQLVKAVRRLEGCELRKGSGVVDVVRGAGGEVVGARVQPAGGGAARMVRARRGVVFATGGYSRDQAGDALAATLGPSWLAVWR